MTITDDNRTTVDRLYPRQIVATRDGGRCSVVSVQRIQRGFWRVSLRSLASGEVSDHEVPAYASFKVVRP